MPVDDHPVHEKTRIAADTIYGCHNRQPFAAGYYAPDRRYRPDGMFHTVQKRITHELSRDCKYDQPNDPRCGDCNWRMK